MVGGDKAICACVLSVFLVRVCMCRRGEREGDRWYICWKELNIANLVRKCEFRRDTLSEDGQLSDILFF